MIPEVGRDGADAEVREMAARPVGPKKGDVKRFISTVRDSVSHLNRAEPSIERSLGAAWLEDWHRLDEPTRKAALPIASRLLDLQDDVSAVFKASNLEQNRNELLNALDHGGHALVLGAGPEVAEAVADSVQRSVNEQRTLNNNSMALWMLVLGLFIQSFLLFAIFLIAKAAGFPADILGLRSLTIAGVVGSGVVGSLARAVNDARSGQDTPANVYSLATTAIARPLLAAVLVAFVFALFQSDMLGTPFKDSTLKDWEFGKQDFFFVAISFAIGFNDKLGLDLLGVASRALGAARVGGEQSPRGAKDAARKLS